MASGSPLARFMRFLGLYADVAGRAAALLSVGVLRSEGRERLNRLRAVLDPSRPRLREVSLSELVPEDATVFLPRMDLATGNVSPFELTVLALVARGRRPRRIFEIGTFDGRSTCTLAANAPEDARLFTLDLPEEMADATRYPIGDGERAMVCKSESGARFKGTVFARRIHQLHGDSGTFDFSPYRGTMDLVFVDGSHEYEYVRNDSLNALSMAAPGGIILWHDFGGCWAGATKALLELNRTHPGFAGMGWVRDTSFACLEVAGD